MDKSPDAFRTISEVADWLGTPTHVLRFWESRFTQVKPVKRAGGRRYYRPADVALLGGIKKLLHDDGLTIRGVQKILREEGVKHVTSLSDPVEGWDDSDFVIEHAAEANSTPDNVVPLTPAQSQPDMIAEAELAFAPATPDIAPEPKLEPEITPELEPDFLPEIAEAEPDDQPQPLAAEPEPVSAEPESEPEPTAPEEPTLDTPETDTTDDTPEPVTFAGGDDNPLPAFLRTPAKAEPEHPALDLADTDPVEEIAEEPEAVEVETAEEPTETVEDESVEVEEPATESLPKEVSAEPVASEPEVAAEPTPEAEPEPTPEANPEPKRPVFVMPQMPEAPTKPSVADRVRLALLAGPQPDLAALRPIYDRLTTLRTRMADDNRSSPEN